MSTNTILFEDSREVVRSEGKPSPLRLLVILAAMIFSAETVAMIALYFLKLPNYFMEMLLDGCLMLVLILPGLYYFQLKPLITQIEQRDRVERALRSNEELLRKVLEILPVGVIVLDTQGEILQDNSTSREIWGDENIVGQVNLDNLKGWWVPTGKPVEPDEWSATRAIRQGKSILNEEIEIETSNGAHKILLNSAVPLLDEHNAIQGAVVVNVDVTERRLAQEQLARQNEELRALNQSEIGRPQICRDAQHRFPGPDRNPGPGLGAEPSAGAHLHERAVRSKPGHLAGRRHSPGRPGGMGECQSVADPGRTGRLYARPDHRFSLAQAQNDP